jgi:hypothetical protein
MAGGVSTKSSLRYRGLSDFLYPYSLDGSSRRHVAVFPGSVVLIAETSSYSRPTWRTPQLLLLDGQGRECMGRLACSADPMKSDDLGRCLSACRCDLDCCFMFRISNLDTGSVPLRSSSGLGFRHSWSTVNPAYSYRSRRSEIRVPGGTRPEGAAAGSFRS